MYVITALAAILWNLSEIAGFLPVRFPYQTAFAQQYEYILLVLLGLVIFYASTVLKFRVFILLIIAFAVSTGSELLGTAYGWVYGYYYYTDSFLGDKLFGLVPLSIPLLWTIIIMLAYSITNVIDPANFFSLKKKLNVSSFLYVSLLSTLDGFFAMSIDMLLDPIYTRFGAWIWPDGGAYFGIPISNFISWFFVAFMATLIFRIYCLPRPYEIEVNILYFAPVIGFSIVVIAKYGILSYVIGHIEYAVIGLSLMFPFIAIATLSYRLKKSKADVSITRGTTKDSQPLSTGDADG